MHLTLVISSLSSGGAERVLSQLANHWIKQGHKVTLVTLASPDSPPFYPLDLQVDLIQLNQSQAETSLLERAKNIYKRVFSLRQTLKKLKPDRIVSFVDMMNITTLLATFGMKTPVIVCERTHPGHYRIPRLYTFLRTLLYPRATSIVMQTASAASYFKNFNAIKIISNAVVVPPQVKQPSSLKAKKIISVGRLCPFKGFATLIHAFSKLAPSYPELTLTIYGEGEERETLTKLIDSLGLSSKALLPGATRNIYPALLDADLFVFPSHYEGFPNALCEAMAVGLPIIASNCSGNVDIVRDGIDGRLFPVEDKEALAALMVELIEDNEQRMRLGERAQEVCARFSADHVYKLWDQVLNEV